MRFRKNAAGIYLPDLPVADSTPLVHDPTDTTKQVRIDAGAVATATTRVLTIPDRDVDLDDADTLGYTPTDSDAWLVVNVDSIQDALDDLADRALAAPTMYSGHYYGSMWHIGEDTTSSSNPVQYRAHYMPFLVPTKTTFDRFGVQVDTAESANFRLGIYQDSGSGTPASQKYTSGDLSSSGITPFWREATGLSITLTRGLWWLAFIHGGTSADFERLLDSTVNRVLGNSTNSDPASYAYQDIGSLSLPSTAGIDGFASNRCFWAQLRVA